MRHRRLTPGPKGSPPEERDIKIDPTIRTSTTNRRTVKTTCTGRKNDGQTRREFKGCKSVCGLSHQENGCNGNAASCNFSVLLTRIVVALLLSKNRHDHAMARPCGGGGATKRITERQLAKEKRRGTRKGWSGYTEERTKVFVATAHSPRGVEGWFGPTDCEAGSQYRIKPTMYRSDFINGGCFKASVLETNVVKC